MGDNKRTSIISVPSGLPNNLSAFLNQMLREVQRLSETSVTKDEQKITLSKLLGGTAASQQRRLRASALPPVANYRVEPFPNYIVFSVSENLGHLLELWRGVGPGAESSSAQRVLVTDRLTLEDHPPGGETYRYWLRYASTDVNSIQFGPFVPELGIVFSAAALANPEETNAGNVAGTVFLETFEGEDFLSRWFIHSGAPAISFPLAGVVGGKVLRVDGDELHASVRDVFPFEAEQLYRMKVGVRLSAAASSSSNMTDVRFGFQFLDIDKNVLDTGGGTSTALSHWFAAFDVELDDSPLGTYLTFTGYLRGTGSAPSNNAVDVSFPSVARTGARYWRPTFDVNRTNGDGTTEIDYIRVDVLNPVDTSPLPWLVFGNVRAGASTARKHGGTSAWGEGSIASVVSHETAHLQFKADQNSGAIMVGFSAKPYVSSDYTTIDHALYITAAGEIEVYESGSFVAAVGSYTTQSLLSMTYDGTSVRYYSDGVLLHTTTNAGKRFYLDSAFYTPNTGINSLEFGPGVQLGVVDTPQIGEDAATAVLSVEVGSYSSPASPFGIDVVDTISIPAQQTDFTIQVTAVFDGWNSYAANRMVTLAASGVIGVDPEYFAERELVAGTATPGERITMSCDGVWPAGRDCDVLLSVAESGGGGAGAGTAELRNLGIRVELIKR